MVEKQVDIKEEYGKLKKKYKQLPSFEVMDYEFEISSIENDGYIIRRIVEQIVDEIEYLLKLLENILQPDTNSFSAMYECNCYSGEEKRQTLELFKKLMVFHREGVEKIVELEEKNSVDYVCRITKEWKNYRKQTLTTIKKLKQCWVGTKEYKEILQYLG